MSKTEILSNIGVGSGINTTELIKALVDADTAPQKENLNKLEERTQDTISTFGILKSNLQDFKNILNDIQSQQEYGFVGNSSDTTVATLAATGTKATAASPAPAGVAAPFLSVSLGEVALVESRRAALVDNPVMKVKMLPLRPCLCPLAAVAVAVAELLINLLRINLPLVSTISQTSRSRWEFFCKIFL